MNPSYLEMFEQKSTISAKLDELMTAEVSDAILLSARLNNVWKQYNLGLCEASECIRTLNQIDNAITEMQQNGKRTV